ncbi:hypothetical protein ACFXKG_30395 [Streptomyces sp. NPDC059255]|uniref:hypothetical protein n=1 Tax=Streptomyces sp. NPDC059255 TaxID=3346793 RepID=UPI003685B66F
MSNLFSRAERGRPATSAHRSRPGRSRTPRAALLTLAGATALAVLTACGGGEADTGTSGQGDVASITSPAGEGGSAPPTGAEPDSGRPQIRLDSTNEEINRMYEAWTACLRENGAGDKEKTPPDAPGVKACEGKQPLDPPELDPARNPDYRDDARTMVRCMNKRGIKSVVTEEGWGLEDGASMNAPHYDEARTDCQVKAFGGDD